MIDSFRTFWDKVGCRKRYWIPVLFFTISTFGYSVFSRTISIDDLSADFYVGNTHPMIGANRWGMEVIHRLAAIPRVSPGSDRLLATVFLMLAGVLLSALFFHLHHADQGTLLPSKYTILTCSLVTYPMIGEIWEYTGANYISTGGMLLSIVTCYYLLIRGRIRGSDLLLGAALMTIPMSSYESGVAFYVTLVCGILFYRYCVWGERNRKWDYWKTAISFVLVLVLALCFRLLIGSLLRWILKVPKGFSGEAVISWGEANLVDMLRRLYIETVLNYGINGLVYLPIGVFCAAVVFLAIYAIYKTIEKKSIMVIVGSGIFLLSVFTLTLIQGSIMFYRTALPLSVFSSVTFFCLAEALERQKKIIRTITALLFFYLIWIQSSFLNSELALNNQRSENEMRTMSIVAQRILSLDSEKPVVFIGQYDMGNYINETKTVDSESVSGQIYEKLVDRLQNAYGDYFHFFTHFTSFPTTNVNSVINWALRANEMEDYLSYLGFDIQVVNMWTEKDAVAEAKEIVESTEMHSYDVMETDGFIIATLQLN